MLINIEDKERMAIVPLWRLIFQYTFAKKTCPYTAKQTIETQILKWNGFVNMNKAREAALYGQDATFTPVGKKGSILDEFEYQVGLMCSWVVREEKGEFMGKVEAYARAEVDYRLVQPMCRVFPEYASKRNYARGQSALLQNMKDFPEIYNRIKKGV